MRDQCMLCGNSKRISIIYLHISIAIENVYNLNEIFWLRTGNITINPSSALVRFWGVYLF